MRGIIQDKVSDKFIEGPTQSILVNNNFQDGIVEKATYQADINQEFEPEADVNANIYDVDKLLYEANERYD